MATIHIPAAIRSLTGGADRIVVPGDTLGEAIDRLEELHPGVKARLVEDGRLRGGLSVFVDGELPRTGLRTRLHPAAEVYFAPAIAGGSAAGPSA